MKATHVEYFDYGVVSGELISMCGDRAIIRLDARMSLDNAHMVAKRENGVNRPMYPAYQLFAGELNRENYQPISEIIVLRAE